MKSPLQILHLEDDPADAELVRELLQAEGIACAVKCVRTRQEYELALERADFDLIISDYSLPKFDGLSALALAREKCPEKPVILVSGTMGEEAAVESLKRGATDYVLKDRLARLPAAVRRAVSEAEEFARLRSAETALRHTEDKIREQAALLDKAQDAIVVRDLEDRILYWNKSAERLYGWTAEEAIGKNANKLLYQGDSFQLDRASRIVLDRGEWVGELRQVTKGGKAVIVESRWTLVRDKNGEPEAKLIINTDITERKKLEAQFLRAQRLETIGALAGGIAHDLKNTLSPILMGTQLLAKELTSESSHKLLGTMQTSAVRGLEMINQILTFARGVGGEPAVLQIEQVVGEMQKLARETFPRSIQISSRTAPGLYPVVGNATQLHQVLLNLCINARDAMPEGGTLTIEAANARLNHRSHGEGDPVSGAYVVLTVSDTGHGISPEVRDRIFEPFFTTKEAGKGTGLGLSTVQGIVKSHGGFLDVSSELDKGTTFRVFLPAQVPAGAGRAEAKRSG